VEGDRLHMDLNFRKIQYPRGSDVTDTRRIWGGFFREGKERKSTWKGLKRVRELRDMKPLWGRGYNIRFLGPEWLKHQGRIRTSS